MIAWDSPYVNTQFHIFSKNFCRAENAPEKYPLNQNRISPKIKAPAPDLMQRCRGFLRLLAYIVFIYIYISSL
jgi:hypothetical protein